MRAAMIGRSQDDACFIIGAIGDWGDPVHEQAEWVRMELIEPALALANGRLRTKLWAYRSDMRHRSEDLWQAILHSILNDRLVFAILDDHRPNISYELGIALSAARPTIILKDRRFPHHFDIYHFRYVKYSRSDTAPVHGRTVDELSDVIVDTYEAELPTHAFHSDRIRPLNGRPDHLHLYEKFIDISYEDWSKVLVRADKRIDLVGKTLVELVSSRSNRFVLRKSNGEAMHVSLKELLASLVLLAGIQVTIVVMHRDNPALEGMIEGTSQGVEPSDLTTVREQLAQSIRLWTEFADRLNAFDPGKIGSTDFAALRAQAKTPLPKEKRGSIKIVQLRQGQVKFRMTLTDMDVIATPIFYKLGLSGSGPAIRAARSTNTYAALRQELDYLKAINGEPPAELGAAE